MLDRSAVFAIEPNMVGDESRRQRKQGDDDEIAHAPNYRNYALNGMARNRLSNRQIPARGHSLSNGFDALALVVLQAGLHRPGQVTRGLFVGIGDALGLEHPPCDLAGRQRCRSRP